MKYLLLINVDEKAEAAKSQEEMGKVFAAYGQYTEELQLDTCCTVRPFSPPQQQLPSVCETEILLPPTARTPRLKSSWVAFI